MSRFLSHQLFHVRTFMLVPRNIELTETYTHVMRAQSTSDLGMFSTALDLIFHYIQPQRIIFSEKLDSIKIEDETWLKATVAHTLPLALSRY